MWRIKNIKKGRRRRRKRKKRARKNNNIIYNSTLKRTYNKKEQEVNIQVLKSTINLESKTWRAKQEDNNSL